MAYGDFSLYQNPDQAPRIGLLDPELARYLSSTSSPAGGVPDLVSSASKAPGAPGTPGPISGGLDDYLKYWNQPILGGVPLNRFVTLAGLLAHSIAPQSFGGRLGGALAGEAKRAQTIGFHADLPLRAAAIKAAAEQERQRRVRAALLAQDQPVTTGGLLEGTPTAPGYTPPPPAVTVDRLGSETYGLLQPPTSAPASPGSPPPFTLNRPAVTTSLTGGPTQSGYPKVGLAEYLQIMEALKGDPQAQQAYSNLLIARDQFPDTTGLLDRSRFLANVATLPKVAPAGYPLLPKFGATEKGLTATLESPTSFQQALTASSNVQGGTPEEQQARLLKLIQDRAQAQQLYTPSLSAVEGKVAEKVSASGTESLTPGEQAIWGKIVGKSTMPTLAQVEAQVVQQVIDKGPGSLNPAQQAIWAKLSGTQTPRPDYRYQLIRDELRDKLKREPTAGEIRAAEQRSQIEQQRPVLVTPGTIVLPPGIGQTGKVKPIFQAPYRPESEKTGKPTTFDKQVETWVQMFGQLEPIGAQPGYFGTPIGSVSAKTPRDQATEIIANEKNPQRRSAMEAAFSQVFSRRIQGRTPAAQKTTSSDPLEGRTATGPGGKKVIRHNGQWVPYAP